MFGIVAIIAIIGIALLINHLLGSMGMGLVSLFEKIGIGKVGVYIFGGVYS